MTQTAFVRKSKSRHPQRSRPTVGAVGAMLVEFRELLLAFGSLLVLVTCASIGSRQSGATVSGLVGSATGSPPAHSTNSTEAIPIVGSAQSGQPAAAGNWQGEGRADAGRRGSGEPPGLSNWRNARDDLAAGRRSGHLRVLWFGDSHTAADYISNAVRQRMAQRLAIGGPGYLSLGVPGYRHGMAKVWSVGDLELSPHPPARRSPEDDGVFGLGGTRVKFRDRTSTVSARPIAATTKTPMNFELTYRLPSRADALRVSVGGQKIELSSESSDPLVAGIRQYRFQAPADSTLELKATRGQPELFGVVVETEKPGLVLDTLGINGARFGTVLAWQAEAFVELVQQRQPMLLVVAYGTNELFDGEPVARHAQRLVAVVDRLRRGAPGADCLVIGPTDIGKGGESVQSRVVALDAAERQAAEKLRCVYFSPFALIAGEGGYGMWAAQEPPLALSDGIHFSVRGYTRIGEAIAELLLM